MFDLSPIVALIVLYILREPDPRPPGQLLSALPRVAHPPRRRRDRRGEGRAALAARPARWGVQDGALRVQIAAPPHAGPVERRPLRLPGRARPGVRPSAARIRRGSGGARKLVEVDGDPRPGRRAAWRPRSAWASRRGVSARGRPARARPSPARHRAPPAAPDQGALVPVRRCSPLLVARRSTRSPRRSSAPSWTRARRIEVFPRFSISRVTNEGIAFGLFPGRQARGRDPDGGRALGDRDRAGGPGGAQRRPSRPAPACWWAAASAT